MSAHSGACEEVLRAARCLCDSARRDRAAICWRESSRAAAPTSSARWDKPDLSSHEDIDLLTQDHCPPAAPARSSSPSSPLTTLAFTRIIRIV